LASIAWRTRKAIKGAELEVHYVETLGSLGTEKGMLGQIFGKAQNKITDPARLARLIEIVDGVEWVMLGTDTKGDIYEGILEMNTEDTKSGAGQYFTPRALIAAMVECVAPEPGRTIADLDHLPEPADLVEVIIDNIEAGLTSFRAVAASLATVGGG